VFPRPFLYLGTLALFVGNGAFIVSTMCGSMGRRHFDDIKWALLTPLYQVLLSVGAWKGFIQLLYKPNYWEKTVHGFCRIDGPDAGALVGPGVPAAALAGGSPPVAGP
jgi:hypothetical protein